MAEIDHTLPIVSLSSVADLLKAKIRTLRMYEDKKLLPRKEGHTKKLYSLNDIQQIELVHYLASVKKVNANGIREILALYHDALDDDARKRLHEEAEKGLRQSDAEETEVSETL